MQIPFARSVLLVLAATVLIQNSASAADVDVTMTTYSSAKGEELVDVDADGPWLFNYAGCCLHTHVPGDSACIYRCIDLSCEELDEAARSGTVPPVRRAVRIRLDAGGGAITVTIAEAGQEERKHKGSYDAVTGSGEIEGLTYSLN